MNLRMTLGLALDKQTDVSDLLLEEDLKTYLTEYIFFPPHYYYNKDISMTLMP